MKKLISLMMLLVWAVSVLAVPANRKPILVKQSDGTMLNVVLKGDEALHYYTTLDGKFLVKNETGDFCYATYMESEGFVSTNVLAHEQGQRNALERELLQSIDSDAINNAVVESHAARSAKYRTSVASASAKASRSITKGEVFIPVLLIEYQDVKFTYTKEDINKLLNETGYSYDFSPGRVKGFGSARDYFIAQSNGQFTPHFVVSDILTLPNRMSYYGGNDSSGSDKNPQGIIRDGIPLADANMDFSKFDNDGDGEVDFIYCIYAGYAESNNADENTIWPHQWSLESKGGKVLADGVNCNIYACSSELNLNEKYESGYGKWMAGIGTMCHEFSHCLGLHDVYDVTYKSGNWGMDEWDLMASGNYAAYGYIPVGYNSFQKEACGWLELEVLDERGTYSMLPQTQNGTAYKIVNDANHNEYFILENRKREGWDQAFRADGMMIIHVDYNENLWNLNKVNTTSGHPRFQIVPADNELVIYSDSAVEEFYASLAGDLWPGKNNNTEFTNTSLPAATVFKGGYLNKPVTNIKYKDGVASFNFLCDDMLAPVALPATEISTNSFVANWNSVEYATEYLVELYRQEATEDGAGDVIVLLEEDFMNCSKSATPIQDDVDAYMSSPGWGGNNIYSETGMLCIGSLNKNGVLSTPLLDAVGNATITFKVAKYNSNSGSFNLVVEVLDASGNVLSSKNVSSAGSHGMNVAVDGAFSLRFSTDAGASAKRVLLDDINIIATLSYKMQLVEEVKTTKNSYKFSKLDANRYAYRVRALDGDIESDYSNYVNVALSTTSVVGVYGEDGDVAVYTLTGIKVYQGTKDAVIDLPTGMYILKSNGKSEKIFVR